MNRSHSHQNQVATKLLSSKFLYPQTPRLQLITHLITKGTIKMKNPQVGASTLTFLWGRKPSFTRTLLPREYKYRLVHLLLTSNKRGIPHDLDWLAQGILPFQLDEPFFPLLLHQEGESSWRIEGCTPPPLLDPLLFPYPILDERFNLTIFLLHKTTSLLHISFYLHLFQLPVTLSSENTF